MVILLVRDGHPVSYFRRRVTFLSCDVLRVNTISVEHRNLILVPRLALCERNSSVGYESSVSTFQLR